MQISTKSTAYLTNSPSVLYSLFYMQHYLRLPGSCPFYLSSYMCIVNENRITDKLQTIAVVLKFVSAVNVIVHSSNKKISSVVGILQLLIVPTTHIGRLVPNTPHTYYVFSSANNDGTYFCSHNSLSSAI